MQESISLNQPISSYPEKKMTGFPSPIILPETISQSRTQRNRELLKAAKWGVFVRLSIIIFEMIGYLVFRSAALKMDALSSMVDVAATLLLIFFIKLANKPPDRNHPLGHGRYEPLAGLQLGVSMILIGGGMLIKESYQLFQPREGLEAVNPLAWTVPLLAMFLLELSYHFVMHTAKKQNSPALAADAVHYRIDGITSLLATLALIAAAYFPSLSWGIDQMGAILIALFMVIVGLSAARNNTHQLLDRVPDPEFFTRVRESSLKVAGVLDTEKIRIQLYGPDAQVWIDVEVAPELSVEQAHKISQEVRAAIQKDWPAVRDVIVHIEPYYPNDHVPSV